MRIQIILISALALIANVSCTANDKPPAHIPDAKQCKELGGAWVRAGMMNQEQCDIPTSDAGKACSDNSECQSYCMAPEGATPGSAVTGRCYKSHLLLGSCLAQVIKGKAEPALCVD